MGVNIAAIDMPFLTDYLSSHIDGLRGNYICVSNVHTTVTAFEDEEYRKVQNGSAMCIPDGGPLAAVGRNRGYVGMQRTTGPDLMRILFECTDRFPLRHFYYGSSEQTLNVLATVLKQVYPKVQVAGMFNPPFKELFTEEDSEHIKLINATKPDIVWVGLGAPKQERWMAVHEGKINALMLGVGAGFDYFAGNIKRAPLWMQKSNLEWVYRLLQDPKRLARRYITTNSKFIWHAVFRGK